MWNSVVCSTKRLIPTQSRMLSFKTEEPLEDYSFDSDSFSKPAMKLVTNIEQFNNKNGDANNSRNIER